MKASLLFSGITTTILSFVLGWLFLSFISGDQRRSDFRESKNTPVLFQKAAAFPEGEPRQGAEQTLAQSEDSQHQLGISSAGFIIGLPF